MSVGGPDLVIFDLDGVLVDSEILACRALSEVLTAHGFPYAVEEVAERFVGVAFAGTVAAIETEHRRPLPSAFTEEINAHLEALFAAELRAIACAEALLSGLVPARCLASNSPPDYIDRALAHAGLDRHLPPGRRFSAAMVERPKPAPDLFLHAARACGAAPASCVVVEDSESGARGATAAGMTVLGFLGGGHIADPERHAGRLRAAGAHSVFDDLARLPELLTSL